MINLLDIFNGPSATLRNGQKIFNGSKLKSSDKNGFYWLVEDLNPASNSFRAKAYDIATNTYSAFDSGTGDTRAYWWSLYE